MHMESLFLLEKLEQIPLDPKYADLEKTDLSRQLSQKRSREIGIEAAVGTEAGLMAIFDSRNVPDDVSNAYKSAFSKSKITLFEHYQEVAGKGEMAVEGFVNNLKGKLFEFRLTDSLDANYPEYKFEIAPDLTNPIWDIKGTNIEDGSEILIQAKIGTANYAGDVLDRMHSDPTVFFALGDEIQEKILSIDPDLGDQIIGSGLSNYEFTEDVKNNLDVISSNLGIDLPDNVGDFLPYVGEVILGIRLILDIIAVQRDFSSIQAADKNKLCAVKALALFGRFGVTSVCVTVGTAGGSFALPPPFGQIGGALCGTILSIYLNKKLKPYILDCALGLTNLTKDDLFYFQNKKSIDSIGLSLNQFSIGLPA